MNFIYPYKRKGDDFLISQSIRLVEYYYPDARIIIVGDRYKDYEHIACKDSYMNRGANVTNKLLIASKLVKDFVFMNDDFLINDRFQFDKHHKHTDKLVRREGKASIEWNTAVDNVKHWLKHHNLPTNCYENHQPILMNSSKFRELMSDINWKSEAHFIKSLYCNVYPQDNITIDNTKLIRSDIKRANLLLDFVGCLSIGDGFLDELGRNYIKTLI